ncbi:MAG: CPBP family intramembrane metalloprotease [Lachnospiraceae bacterium]|nr:CPBP family intramembrane metalloprotease [Lachnospiraceae bacterium]
MGYIPPNDTKERNKHMKKLYEKNEVRFAVIMIVIYVIGTSLGEYISEATGTFKVASAIFHVAFGIFLFAWIKRNGLMEKYGLVKPAYKLYKAWFFIPLFLIGCSRLFFGLSFNYSAFGTACYLLSMFGVGFLEEILFRGFLFEGMAKNNVKAAIIVSSITFGVGHIVNLLNGQDLFETLLQIVFAVAVGFVLVTLYYKGGSIIPCMIFHAVNNSCSAFNKPEMSAQFFGGAKNEMIITVVAAIVISVVYSIAMWLKLEKTK